MEKKEIILEDLVNKLPHELPDFVNHENIVYCCKNLINGKLYIGETKRSLRGRWMEHKYMISEQCGRKINMAIYDAIRKYGMNNFSVSILEENLIDSAYRKIREQYWIEKYNSFIDAENSNGYNMTTGGDSDSKSSREKTNRGVETRIKKYGKAVYLTEDSIKRAIETNRNNHGGILAFQSEECRKKGFETQIKKYGMLAIHLPNSKEKQKAAIEKIKEQNGGVLPFNTKEAIEKAQKSAPLYRMIGCISRHIDILKRKGLDINAKNYVLKTDDVKHMWQQHIPHVLRRIDELRSIYKWTDEMEGIFSNIEYNAENKGISKIVFKNED